MKQSIHYTLTTLSIFCLVITILSAQTNNHLLLPPDQYIDIKPTYNKAEIEEATKITNDLSTNTLVVRLRSGTKKKLALETLLKDKTLTKKQRKYIQKQLDEHISFTRETNQFIMKGFKENYSFSQVLFMYNTDSKALYKSQKQGYFLNDDFKIDSTITLTTPTFYTCDLKRIGTGRELEGFVIQNDKKEEPSSPFPTKTAAPTNPGKYIWNSLVGKKNKGESHAKAIIKLNDRLNRLKE